MFTIESFVSNEANRSPGNDAGIYMANSNDIAGEHFDPGLARPYLDDRGRSWVDVTIGFAPKKDRDGVIITNMDGSPIYHRVVTPQLVAERKQKDLPVVNVTNASTLRKDQWIQIDATVLRAARARLKAWADLRAANTYGGFDGMATTILEHEIMSEPGEAIVDMEGITEGRGLQPTFALQGLPLPITHCDFYMSQRFLAASRRSGQPQDTMRAELAGRTVGEKIEKMTIGTEAAFQYGVSTDYHLSASKVYGYTTHPSRILKTDLTASASFVGETFVNEVLAMRELAYAQHFHGPFMLYVSTAYDAKLDLDYTVGTSAQGLASPTGTVRQRVRQIDGITDVRRLDYLSGDVLLLVQMTSDVAQAVNGLEVTTVQWETKGGMQRNFKVMAIQVPRIRSVYVRDVDTGITGTSTVTGIVHGTTS